MIGVTWLLVSLLIVAGYIMLFWLVRKNYINFKTAGILLTVSLICYIGFPIMLKKVGLQYTLLFLLLFLLFGVGLMLAVDKKIKWEEKLRFNIDLSKIKLQFSETKKMIEKSSKKIVSLKEEIVKRVKSAGREKAADTEMVEEGLHLKDIAEEQDILNNFDNDEDLSYVDFEDKDKKCEDLFVKYIRGEFAVNDVINGIKERGANAKLHTLENNERKCAETEGLIKQADCKSDSNNSGVPDQDKDSLTIEQCIEHAFELKSKGLFLDAVEYYITALDKKPDEQLMLWIIVDICSLYKQLGQEDMAKETMKSYIEAFGDSLNTEVKEELLKSLQI